MKCLVLTLLLIVGSRANAAENAFKNRANLTACAGKELVSYIGKSVNALRERHLAEMRFVCEKDCLMTADFHWSRITVFYSRRNNIVTRMSCG